MEIKTLITKSSADYELIDSGNEEKLERYGKYVLRRPDPQALWKKTLSETEWKNADAIFDSNKKVWKFMQNELARSRNAFSLRDGWKISFDDLKFNIKPTAFKHTGVFPEQEQNWVFIKSKIKSEKSKNPQEPIKILNLFGYTGGATLAALSAGAEVTHVDGSKAAITWAKENIELSGLNKKPVRWIIDDARKFVMREIKRGGKYDAIIMDPPSFGRGGKGEIWKIETDFIKLLDECSKILSDNPLFFLINGYAAGYSSRAYYNALAPIMKKYGGSFEFGELTIEESKDLPAPPAQAGQAGKRLLPCGIFARWSKN